MIEEELCKKVTKDKLKCEFELPIVKRNFLLLHAHNNRLHRLLTPRLLTDLNELLVKSEKIIDHLIEIATIREWFNVCETVINYRRELVQGVMNTNQQVNNMANNVLLQIPYMNNDRMLKVFGKNYYKKQIQLRQIVDQAEEAFANEEVFETNQEKLDALEFLRHIPNLTCDLKVFVDDERKPKVKDIKEIVQKGYRQTVEDVHKNDIASVEVTLLAFHARYLTYLLGDPPSRGVLPADAFALFQTLFLPVCSELV